METVSVKPFHFSCIPDIWVPVSWVIYLPAMALERIESVALPTQGGENGLNFLPPHTPHPQSGVTSFAD